MQPIDVEPAAAPPEPPAPTGRRRSRRGLYWLALLVSAVVFAGAGTIAVLSYFEVDKPGAVVSSYFSALARGDAPGALAFGSVPSGDHRYLTSPVLREQLQLGSIGQVEVESVDQHGRTASVNVQYQLGLGGGSRTVNDAVAMVERAGRWRLASSAVAVTVSLGEAANRLTFAGTAIPDGPVLLFPGALPVRFDTPNLQVVPDDAIVRFADTGIHSVDVAVSAQGMKTVTAALDAAVSTCLATAPADALCPVPDPGTGVRVVPGSLQGTVAQPAKITTRLAASADGVISIVGSFDADGSYTTLDFNNQPIVKTGAVTVPITAHCFATAASAISWDVPS